jgi:hypothetical protein
MQKWPLATLVVLAAPLGCSHRATAPCNTAQFSVAAPDSAPADSGWRGYVLAHVARLPPSDVKEATFMGLSAADSAIWAPYGGSVVYNYNFITAVEVQLTVGDWMRFASDPNSDPENRVSTISFGLVGTPQTPQGSECQ